MRYYITLSFLGVVISGWSQQVSPSVIATSGNSLQNGSVAIDFTIGEPLTTTYQNGPVLVTQGFHQPIISLANISEWDEANVQFYPNPTADKLILQISINSFQQVQIIDAQGKLVYQQYNLKEVTEIAISQLATGKYNLILSGSETKNLSFIKID